MRSFTSELCRGVSKPSGILKFTEGYLQVTHPWNTVETSLGSLNILYKAVHSLWGASLQEIWPSMYFYGLCYCNRQLIPSLPLSPWWTGVPHAALCGSVCVWLWENFSTVRESPPLSGPAFPLGRWGGCPLCSEMLSPTTPPGPFLPQQILVVEVVAEFLCPVFRFPNLSYLHYRQAQQ